jgi:copper(I)-binding protein
MRAAAGLVILSAALLGGCNGKAGETAASSGTLAVDHAWVRLAPVPDRPAAAYFTLHGGKTDEQLTAVTSPQAARAEMHETMSGHHGMSMMAPLKAVPVPAGGTVTFAPAGRHVMLFGLDPAVTAGRAIRLDLTFASGRKLSTEARVRAMGDDGE